jgi:hypothetical protein
VVVVVGRQGGNSQLPNAKEKKSRKQKAARMARCWLKLELELGHWDST